jgi:SAM-dependent methyltransferase
MRYTLVPDNQMEERLLDSGPAARMLFDPFLPVLQARALLVAVRVGIFRVLGRDLRTAEEVAAALSLDPHGMGLLLNVLACAGYMEKEGPGFRVVLDPAPLEGWIRFNEIHWEVIAGLEQVVRTGKTVDVNALLTERSAWGLCHKAMLETARPAAPWVASQVPIPEGAKRMLDIGGSHGLYAAMICRAHPPLQAEIVELPEAVESARQLAADEGLDDVTTHIAGNVLEFHLGSNSCDAVFLGNLCHHFNEQQNIDLLNRVHRALRVDGTVVVWEFKLPDADEEPDIVAHGLALYFHLTSAARCYTADEYVGWLNDRGFRDVMIHAAPAPAQLLITARA